MLPRQVLSAPARSPSRKAELDSWFRRWARDRGGGGVVVCLQSQGDPWCVVAVAVPPGHFDRRLPPLGRERFERPVAARLEPQRLLVGRPDTRRGGRDLVAVRVRNSKDPDPPPVVPPLPGQRSRRMLLAAIAEHSADGWESEGRGSPSPALLVVQRGFSGRLLALRRLPPTGPAHRTPVSHLHLADSVGAQVALQLRL